MMRRLPPPSPPRTTAGFTMTELLIAMTMTLAIAGAAWSLFRAQNRAFTSNSDRFDMVQNARGAIEGAERVIRTMGAGTPNSQPVLVYGAANVLSFNTDYIEQDTSDMRWAAYYNPDTPSDQAAAWLSSASGTIPNSSPNYTYPSTTYRLGNGALSPAETYTFYFAADGSTSRSDDYILYQRVNNGADEIIARNILAHPNGKPFFQYLMQRVLTTGDTLQLVEDDDLPLKRRILTTGISSSDSAAYVLPDSVRAIRMNFRLTNGRTGADERFRDVTTTIEVPNNGILLPTVCGRSPFEPATLTGLNVGGAGSGRLDISWPASTDEASGEQDVTQYVLYRRLQASATWADPIIVVKANGSANYTVSISDNVPGTAYTFGVASQDCTPSMSDFRLLNITPTP